MTSNNFLLAIVVVLTFLNCCSPSNGDGRTSSSNHKIGRKEIYDSKTAINFFNDMTDRFDARPFPGKLCGDAKSKSGEFKTNLQTIREILGPDLKSITILRVRNFETYELFTLAEQAIVNALLKSPRHIYQYEPWANTVSPDFIARLEYANGKVGELEMTYEYICFQDEYGVHWWARMATADDLNSPKK